MFKGFRWSTSSRENFTLYPHRGNCEHSLVSFLLSFYFFGSMPIWPWLSHPDNFVLFTGRTYADYYVDHSTGRVLLCGLPSPIINCNIWDLRFSDSVHSIGQFPDVSCCCHDAWCLAHTGRDSSVAYVQQSSCQMAASCWVFVVR